MVEAISADDVVEVVGDGPGLDDRVGAGDVRFMDITHNGSGVTARGEWARRSSCGRRHLLRG